MIGAGAYTVGAGIEGIGWPTLIPGAVGPHEVFHVAVLIGAAAHWRFVLQFADGNESETVNDPRIGRDDLFCSEADASP